MFNIGALYTQAAFLAINVLSSLRFLLLGARTRHHSMRSLHRRSFLRRPVLPHPRRAVHDAPLQPGRFQGPHVPCFKNRTFSGIPQIQFKSLCLAQAQHTYFLKAKASKLTNAAFARLQSCTAELYKDTMAFAQESRGFFPAGLVKHFELQSCLASIAALHFEGQALAGNEEENAGLLYRYADVLENAVKQTRALMASFQLEESDRLSAEATLAAANSDIKQFYRIYRIYVGVQGWSEGQITSVPKEIPLPQPFCKAEMVGVRGRGA